MLPSLLSKSAIQLPISVSCRTLENFYSTSLHLGFSRCLPGTSWVGSKTPCLRPDAPARSMRKCSESDGRRKSIDADREVGLVAMLCNLESAHLLITLFRIFQSDTFHLQMSTLIAGKASFPVSWTQAHQCLSVHVSRPLVATLLHVLVEYQRQ